MDATRTLSSWARRRAGPVARGLAAVASAACLVTGFAPFDEAGAAWLGLVPLIILCRFTAPGQAFRWGYLSGLLFWLVNLAWLLNLARTGTTIGLAGLGWLALSAYCALYWGLFAAGVSFLSARTGTVRPARSILLMFGGAVLWTGLEYVRSTLGTGFPWNTLAVSQAMNLPILQVASVGGVYAISFVIVCLNMALALLVLRMVAVWRREDQPRLQVELTVALVLLAGCWIWGVRVVRQTRSDVAGWPEVRVVAVQPAIPQLKKWTPEFGRMIYDRLEEQTSLAALGKPDLVVWPETAVPGVMGSEPEVLEFVRQLADLGSPILVGSLEDATRQDEYFNSSFLVPGGVEPLQVYRKQHLVPFGEYLPFSRQVEWIARLAPLGFTCEAGQGPGLMTLPGNDYRFGALICFEDIMAYLCRSAVKAGASFLVNQTNDAWFDGTAGAQQHMRHCVLRTVEQRIGIVRAANTGVTCAIAPWGEVTDLLDDREGGVGCKGFMTAGIRVRPPGSGLTLYGRMGDWGVGIPCAALSGVIFLLVLLEGKRKSLAP